MFWRFGGYANISTLDKILDKPDVTLEELLDESDLIQELKQQNSKLIEFLRGDAVLAKLLDYVVARKPDASSSEDAETDKEAAKAVGSALDSLFGKEQARSRTSLRSTKDGAGEEEESEEEKQRMKYAYVACEVLSSEVWSISEAIMEDRESLRRFWQFIQQPAPLDPVQAGYFTKVCESLLDRKTDEMLDIFKSTDNVVQDMLQHVDCPTVMDLLLKIISLERSEGGQGIVDWLQTQNLIPILLSYLSPEHASAIQTSAGDFLKAIITISANATTQDQNVIGPNELTRQLVSEPCIQVLVKEMLRGGNPLTVGVGIVIEVIRKNNSDYDLENQIGPVPRSSDPIYLGTLLRQFARSVPEFMRLILNPISDGTTAPKRREMKAAWGDKIEPLGFDRFKTCELMAELLHCSNMALLNERGSESQIKQRDQDREKLKAEGKLQAKGDERAPSSHDFGTSVDSAGFHHARAPSISEPGRDGLGLANNGEDEEFETVASSDALADEIQEELEEALLGSPLERSPKVSPRLGPRRTMAEVADQHEQVPEKNNASPMNDASVDNIPPLKPRRADEPAQPHAPDALEQSFGALGINNEDTSSARNVGNDTELNPATSPADKQTGRVEEQATSAYPEDRPAPLFAKKAPSDLDHPEAGTDTSEPTAAPADTNVPEQDDEDDDDDDDDEDEDDDDDAYRSPYVVDIDGSPVVGDLLKMMFVEHRIVPTILDFFFRFPWNNFLHNVVYDVVQQVFNGTTERGYNRQLAIDLFETGRVTTRIIDGQKASDDAQQAKNMRLGYMGHLTLIAEEVVKFTERHPPEMLAQVVLDAVMSQGWSDYVEHTLAETRERDNAILGGVRPDMAVGPRQAVLNAVNAAQAGGFGGDGSGSLLSSAPAPLDSMEITNNAGNSGFLYGPGGAGGSSLLSDFNNSSDEEDDDIEDAIEGRNDRLGASAGLTDDDQSAQQGLAGASPSPLPVPPSRARRRFAARLAQRQRAMHDAEQDSDDLANATEEINIDDADILDPQPSTSLHDEPDELEDHHPEDSTSAWHDNERIIPVDDEDAPTLQFDSPEGMASGIDITSDGAQGLELSLGNSSSKTSTGRSRGPERFSGLFASDSDSD